MGQRISNIEKKVTDPNRIELSGYNRTVLDISDGIHNITTNNKDKPCGAHKMSVQIKTNDIMLLKRQ